MANFGGGKSGQISMDVKINWPPEPNFISPFAPAHTSRHSPPPSSLPSLLNSIVVLTFPIATVPLRLRTVPHWDINIMKHIATTKPSGGKIWDTNFCSRFSYKATENSIVDRCDICKRIGVVEWHGSKCVHMSITTRWIIELFSPGRERDWDGEVRNWN